MNKKILSVGLLALLGLAACATPTEPSATSSNTSTKAPETSTPTTTVETPEPAPTGLKVMTGTFDDFGGGTVDLYLQPGNKAHFNVTCEQALPTMSQIATNKMFDRTWNYEADPTTGVYYFMAKWEKQGETKPVSKTYVSKYNETSKKHTLDYILVGQRDILVKMEGTLPAVPYMTGEFEDFGGGVVDVLVKSKTELIFDVTLNEKMPQMTQEQSNAVFDRTWTYTVNEFGEYDVLGHWANLGSDFKPDGTFTDLHYKSKINAKGQTEMEYILKGQRDILVNLTGSLPLPVHMTGEFEDFGGGKVDLTVLGNGKAFFDCTTFAVMPGMSPVTMSKMFDRVATYTVNEDGNYKFTLTFTPMDPTTHKPLDPVSVDYVTTKDGENFKLDYVMKGERDIVVPMTGKIPAEPAK